MTHEIVEFPCSVDSMLSQTKIWKIILWILTKLYNQHNIEGKQQSWMMDITHFKPYYKVIVRQCHIAERIDKLINGI